MKKTKQIVAAGSLAAAALGGTLVLGLATSASAATPTPTASASASTDSGSTSTATPSPSTTADTQSESSESAATEAAEGSGSAQDPSKGGHTANGITEVVLTGTTADQVQAAVLAANPGATIQRMENDAEGATYEAHIVKADGTKATVKLDASFAITATETGR